MIETGQLATLNADPALRRWGRLLTADILIDAGAGSWIVHVRDGELASVTRGPFTMPCFTVALRADPAAWAVFMCREPTPGYQDLMGLVRRGELAVEGDLRPFMQHLLWFRRLFEALREQAA